MDGLPLMPPDAVEIVLAGSPVAFARVRIGAKTGRMFEPAKQQEYKAALRLAAADAMSAHHTMVGAVEMVLSSYFPIPPSWTKKQRVAAMAGGVLPKGRPDLDNIVKLAKDALNGVVYYDDAQIVSLRAIKRYDEKPRLEIRVEPI